MNDWRIPCPLVGIKRIDDGPLTGQLGINAGKEMILDLYHLKNSFGISDGKCLHSRFRPGFFEGSKAVSPSGLDYLK